MAESQPSTETHSQQIDVRRKTTSGFFLFVLGLGSLQEDWGLRPLLSAIKVCDAILGFKT